MNIKIENIEVNKTQIKAIIKVEADVESVSNGRYSLQRDIEETLKARIVREVADEYLKENLHVLMQNIDQREILNMVVLRTAGKLTDTGNGRQ